MPIANAMTIDAGAWAQSLADLAAAIALDKGISAPADGTATDAAKAIARSMSSGERKGILLGNAAAHHANASSLLALANWIGAQTGASVGYLTEAANTAGAQLVGAMPQGTGLNAGQMLNGQLKAVVLLNIEPEFDSAAGERSRASLNASQMVVTLSPFKANMSFSDVLLPIAPFTESPGTFINAEGRVQSFHAVVKPLGDARPAWKVMRVLANLLDLPGFDFESAQDVLKQIDGISDGHIAAAHLSNASDDAAIQITNTNQDVPAVASIYQLDGLVRRATSLQLTADARSAFAVHAQAEEVTA